MGKWTIVQRKKKKKARVFFLTSFELRYQALGRKVSLIQVLYQVPGVWNKNLSPTPLFAGKSGAQSSGQSRHSA